MQPNFSEFSFAYALTEALVRSLCGMTGPPLFPTQRQEMLLGYDVRLHAPGCLLFLQFKRCDYMVRDTAAEIAKHNLPLTKPFLRMKLMPAKRSPQHGRLLQLDKPPHRVFYAAPRFYTQNDFVKHYERRQLIHASVFIRPSAIGALPDDNEHHLAFDVCANGGWLVSEPRPAEFVDGTELQRLIQEDLQESRPTYEVIAEALKRVHGLLREMEVQDVGEREGKGDSPLSQLNSLVGLHFGAASLVVQEHMLKE